MDGETDGQTPYDGNRPTAPLLQHEAAKLQFCAAIINDDNTSACHVTRVQILTVNSETMSYIYKLDLS